MGGHLRQLHVRRRLPLKRTHRAKLRTGAALVAAPILNGTAVMLSSEWTAVQRCQLSAYCDELAHCSVDRGCSMRRGPICTGSRLRWKEFMVQYQPGVDVNLSSM